MAKYSKKFQAKLDRIRSQREAREQQEMHRVKVEQVCDAKLKELDGSSIWSAEGLAQFEAEAAEVAKEVQGIGPLALLALVGAGAL